eukprot:CAMPEP_0118929198 /NCGR_PEP_ID=MMETSP1169-20130426/6260_1 /TAXON_ID=36882 /ORGANISM="Pyramimonas obovata, Strain CCMP722" /LENGTH=248 /DNA_ID=CAMNT_0006871337 /DNA_START=82 /DNA_END=828 /DNA_ORIENTATION=-
MANMLCGCKSVPHHGISIQPNGAPSKTKVTGRREALSVVGLSQRSPEKQDGSPRNVLAASVVAGVAAVLVGSTPVIAVTTSTNATLFDRGVERCTMEQLKKGAETRAGFSDFAGEPELLVNIEGCDYSGKNLTNDVLSGVKARGANFAGAAFGRESSRADFRGADMRGATFKSTNLYQADMRGADLRDADFEGALLTGTSFGYDRETEQWANLEGANWEDALFSNTDIKNICENPTILEDDRLLLGCK